MMMKFSSILLLLLIIISLSVVIDAQFNANCHGNRQTLVHLFEWRWVDIAEECERFLGQKGFCGVQVSPPTEHVIIMYDKVKRPWWERYQPVSYKIASRSGNEAEFIDMIQRCNKVGVRIYVDVVLNHMAGEAVGYGVGSGGSPYNARSLDFPAVPYISNDFHKDCKIESLEDAQQVRNCRLLGLLDLDQSKSFVRQKIVQLLNKLIGWGVAGFRLDAAKHMWPADLKIIVDSLDNLDREWFPENSRPFIYQEVIDFDGKEAVKSEDYFQIGRVTEFNYGQYLNEAFTLKRLVKELKNLGSPEFGGYLMPDEKALVFVDNHDNQRGHGAEGKPVLSHFYPTKYAIAVSFMLAWPYGQPRVMSSYRWERDIKDGGKDQNSWVGPPCDENYNILPVTLASNGSCENGWVCEHRWKSIAGMVHFRNVVGGENVANWWDNGANHIAFSRGNKAFFVANAGLQPLTMTLQTGMAPGRYCDVISGERSRDRVSCSGETVIVNEDGTATFKLSPTDETPIVAFHIDSILSDTPVEEPTTVEPTTEPPTTKLPTTEYPTTEFPTTTEAPTTAEAETTTKAPTSSEIPATESPSTEHPTTELRTTEQPTTEPASTTEVPTTEIPSTQPPTTPVPTTELPTTEVPTTELPTTETPTTTEVPTTEAPTTEPPIATTTEAPTTVPPMTKPPELPLPEALLGFWPLNNKTGLTDIINNAELLQTWETSPILVTSISGPFGDPQTSYSTSVDGKYIGLQYVSMPSSFTVSLYYYTQGSGNQQAILGVRNNLQNKPILGFGYKEDQAKHLLEIHVGQDTNKQVVENAIKAGSWSFIALTYNHDTKAMNLYDQFGSELMAAQQNVEVGKDSEVCIGCASWNTNNNQLFTMKSSDALACVMIYGAVLTPQQVSSLPYHCKFPLLWW